MDKIKNLPKIIYLNFGIDEPDFEIDFKDLKEVTWSDDVINDCDALFIHESEVIKEREAVRAEIVNKIEARLAEKYKVLKTIKITHSDEFKAEIHGRIDELRWVFRSLKGDE